MNLSAVILAGGNSSRMGRDKAWVELEGQPLLARALATVQELGIQEIFISGRADRDYSAFGRPVLLDREGETGPLAGLERALETSQKPLTLVLAVDLPRMTATFLRKLVRGCDTRTGAVPEWHGRLEPLVAIYPQTCLPIVRKCLLQNRLAARHFADACRDAGAVSTFPIPLDDCRCFENWNTPTDIANSERHFPSTTTTRNQSTCHRPPQPPNLPASPARRSSR